MPRVLLLLPTTTYRTEAFLDAAAQLGVNVTVASERPNTLSHLNPSGLLTLDFQNPDESAQRVLEFSRAYRIDAVVPVDSQVVVAGAAIAAALGLPHNSVESAIATENKFRMRQRLEEAGVPSPQFTLCSLDEDCAGLASRVQYPCVVKPLSLAASQGVIRADDESQFVCAVGRLEAILKREYDVGQVSNLPKEKDRGSGRLETCPSTKSRTPESSQQFLVEQFIDGPEIALEGMLMRGDLRVLAPVRQTRPARWTVF